MFCNFNEQLRIMNYFEILTFVLSTGLIAFLFRNKFKKSYPIVAKYPSGWLKYMWLCVILGFIFTGLVITLLHLQS